MAKQISFITTNSYKFKVAQLACTDFTKNGFELVQSSMDTPEIQSESVEEVARYSAVWASSQLGHPAIASDVGFSITALRGFPGPFLKYINDWLTTEDLMRLMSNVSDRSAAFVNALAYATPQGDSQVFVVETPGTISDSKTAPDSKWTIDSLFIPAGQTKSLADMSDAEKNTVWDNGIWQKVEEYVGSL